MEEEHPNQDSETRDLADIATVSQGRADKITGLDLCGGIQDKVKLEKLEENYWYGFQADANKVCQWGIDTGIKWLPTEEELDQARDDIQKLETYRKYRLRGAVDLAMRRISEAWEGRLRVDCNHTWIKRNEEDRAVLGYCWSFEMYGRQSLHIAQSGKDKKLHDALVEFKARLGIDEEPQYFTSREEPPKKVYRRPVEKRQVDKLLDFERFLEPLAEVPSDVSSFPGVKTRSYPEGTFYPLPCEQTQTGQDEKRET